jgi:hypothetical protein
MLILGLLGVTHVIDDGVNGESGRHFSGVVPAHPVSHDEQAEVFVDREAVFVERSNPASIRHSVGAHHLITVSAVRKAA